MDINKMTREQLEALPGRKWDEDIGEFDSLIMMPANVSQASLFMFHLRTWLSRRFSWLKPPEVWEVDGLHDSGYRQMDFVAVRDGEGVCRLAGGSDVLHFDGIGGYGYRWSAKNEGIPETLPPRDWSIDCLPKSGLLRLFSHKYNFLADPSLSSFCIYCIEKKGGS